MFKIYSSQDLYELTNIVTRSLANDKKYKFKIVANMDCMYTFPGDFKLERNTVYSTNELLKSTLKNNIKDDLNKMLDCVNKEIDKQLNDARVAKHDVEFSFDSGLVVNEYAASVETTINIYTADINKKELEDLLDTISYMHDTGNRGYYEIDIIIQSANVTIQ